MNNVSTKTRKLTIVSLLAAITFLLGLTPIGYITIPLTTVKITILCVPVIIGVIMEGLGAGLFLGFVFGITSLIQVFMGDPLGMMLLNISPFRTIVIVFIPRLLVPITTYYFFLLLKKIKNNIISKTTCIATALVGSLTNTFFFLGFLYVLFIPELEQIALAFETTTNGLLAILGAIVLGNGVPEAIGAAVIVSAIIIPLEIMRGNRTKVIDKKDTLTEEEN